MQIKKNFIVYKNASVKDAISVINASGKQIAVVVDEDYEILGTVTDGDVRRGLLCNLDIGSSVLEIMNTKPTCAFIDDSPSKLLMVMSEKKLHQILLVDGFGKLHDVITLDDLLSKKPSENSVLLMAGGLGSRMKDLTKACPKPMLQIGGKPILETILCRFIDSGFKKFYISVNYLKEQIIDYFQDGSKWGCQISYLIEDQMLGTAGALSLIQDKLDKPLFVINGDVLSRVDLLAMLDYHHQNQSSATMAVREFEFTIPYGVVNSDQGLIQTIKEKPTYKSFCNAGIYLINPEAFSLIKPGEHIDMPDFINNIKAKGASVYAFPIHEYWEDIGQVDVFHRVSAEFNEFFN